MGDPDIDHGFLYDYQGRVDILISPFFDVPFGNDNTAGEYVDRILYQLTLAIEEQIPAGRWYLVSHPPTSFDPATAPTTTTRSVLLLLVASLGVAYLILCPTLPLLRELMWTRDHYFLFDFPGQVELFFLHSNAKKVIWKLIRELDLRLTAVHLVDAHLCCDPGKYDKESVGNLVKLIDKSNGYIFSGIEGSVVEFSKIAAAPLDWEYYRYPFMLDFLLLL
ncbi:hypothetical protein M5K25_020768 [Dendrobium thyrsiflorum]|uniref:GPN-loop GTPase 2 n=1 Tax=Dendrobium thyrsiflorum TaxID=117978 RepID=A0ABD0UHS1_DENTH